MNKDTLQIWFWSAVVVLSMAIFAYAAVTNDSDNYSSRDGCEYRGVC